LYLAIKQPAKLSSGVSEQLVENPKVYKNSLVLVAINTNEQGTAPCWWILFSYIFAYLHQIRPVSSLKLVLDHSFTLFIYKYFWSKYFIYLYNIM